MAPNPQTTPFTTTKFTSKRARAVEAYLLTLAEDYQESTMFGKVFMQDILTAFSSPDSLKALLPQRLQNRFDWWMAELGTTQLDLFSQE